MDQFFRSPADTTLLAPVPGQLAQMRGVLSVLGLDQASLAVVRMRDMVERLLIGEETDEVARQHAADAQVEPGEVVDADGGGAF